MEEEDDRDARFAAALFAGLMSTRMAVLRAKATAAAATTTATATADAPAVFALDLCAVAPAWQRRGIAARLVRWGLEEAERRGGLEATTEASAMGRHVYAKLGFQPVGEVDYGVGEALLAGRRLPPNLFMRTKP